MLSVAESILPVFAIILIGFLLRKKGYIPQPQWHIVEELCFWIFFPALLASTLIKANLSSIQFGAFTLTLIAMMASVAMLLLALWPLLKNRWGTKASQFSTIYQTTTRWHGFIALAIVINLYGELAAALMAVAFAVMVPILQTSNIFVLLAFSSTARPNLPQLFKAIVSNPIIWGVLTGLIINRLQIEVWRPILSLLDLLGRPALGASLLALGAGLSLQAAFKPSKELLIGLIGKLFLTPAITAAWAFVFGIQGMELSVLLICASVPTAMNGYVLAKKMGGDAQLYAATSTVQTVVSFASIPLILWLAENYANAT